MERLLVWRGLDGWRADACLVCLEEGRLSARGTQIGGAPEPYRLDYELVTGERWVTGSLVLEARSDSWERRLELLRDASGDWTANGEPIPEVAGALDCDLGLCPLTNTMPVLRERLLEPGAQARDFVMAWVAVPALTVHRSEQRYEPIDARTVPYVGKHRDFVGELTFDAEGLVVRYPELPSGSRASGSLGTVKRYHLTTFGCQMNEHDSERMKGMLESLGYSEADTREAADLILFNTCSIRESADNRFIGHLGEAKRLKGEDPTRVVGVGGCWSQSMKERVFELFPFVDVAFGPGQVHRLAEFLTSDSLSAQGYFEFEGFTGHLPMKREREFQAWVQISIGCNCACSYCIVPSTRGREVSRPAAEIVAEVERLAADGVKEVTLLGQNVCSYGRDLPKGSKATFAELLALVDAVDGVERIRYTSPHPKDIREDVLQAHAELPSVCEHIHLPLQSGSSRILKAMRRTYGRERYLDRVAMIRALVPDCALTTDIIVGFPGESDDDFEETMEVVETVRYDSAFTFIFSPRRGTTAADLDGQLPQQVKRERMERLVDVVQRHARERTQRFVGRTMEVLVEGPSRTDPDRLRGRIRHNKTVNFAGVAQPGELTEVEIAAATSTTLAGEERALAGIAG